MPMIQKQMVKLLTKHGWLKTAGGKGSLPCENGKVW